MRRVDRGGGGVILCFDIGGTAIKVAEAAGGAVRPAGRVPTPAGDFAAFVRALQGIVAGASVRPEVLAFSIAGVVDETGIATVANIPCLTGRAVVRDLEAALGLPVVLANDADCFAMAEAVEGAGRGHEVVFGVILGTGVGGGIVVRGGLINAHGGFAGEWGHGPVLSGAALPVVRCGCGQVGCLDTLCSARGMERLHRHLWGRDAEAPALVAGWEAGEPEAARTVALWLEVLAGPLAMVVNLLGPGIVPVGGGLSNSAPLVAALDEAVRARCLRRFDRPLVVPALCRIEPGLIGAAALGRLHLAEGRP
ncbi:ROK family protein [Falsirhodobacter sp. 20TX0035]|uniref:ROK family protein n=1 Tax=Falsirhodobacter sp. 20TX0035 TaxID=3022019 RepID=UPI00232CB304|nr:ROK family protein [Falsirhodobacter sp. 20TX0035]MDB6452882.1 ROK family protein [Falsirhodobacter sp. 20TX0035]